MTEEGGALDHFIWKGGDELLCGRKEISGEALDGDGVVVVGR